MPELTFASPERRSPLPSIALAGGVLAAVAAALFLFNPRDTAALSLSRTSVVPTRTVFRSQTIVVDQPPAGQDDLYIVTTLRIDDHLRIPLTLDTLSLTLVTSEDQETTTAAIAKDDLPAVMIAFPQIRPLAAPPLLRETVIPAAGSGEGQVVFHLPVAKAVWDTRKSATITVNLYGQKPLKVVIA